MPTQDTYKLKEKIISFIRIRGPSLPVHVAKETGLSMLFASAFLSELVSDKIIKISYMKVGNSPIYFMQGQESRLENFSQHLKNKEKDAYLLLKEKKFLKDKEQTPPIRVALRAIKDFAIAFQKNNEIFWRYFNVPESEFKLSEKRIDLSKDKEIIKKEVLLTTKPQLQKEFDIFDKKPIKKLGIKKIKTKIKKTSSKDNKFFNKIKESLNKKSIEITDIESFSKNDLTLKIKKKGQEKLLIAYNKRRITESDILNAYKKAQEVSLPYIILGLGEPSKKIINLINAIKELDEINKIE